ncbi:Hef nuclease [Bacteroidales bacterium Barb6]|nr:Hef nuclease [Bacteroidales bacterium Barb6]
MGLKFFAPLGHCIPSVDNLVRIGKVLNVEIKELLETTKKNKVMLLDNKTQKDDGELFKVSDFIKKYTEDGNLDVVTGFFSVNALALMQDELSQAEKFRLVLGNLIQDESQTDKIIDLLNGNAGIDSSLALSLSARKAVEFLKQERVAVKTVQKNFCHAKAYIYHDKDTRKKYHIVGSSNLTDAGLGLKESSNVELNIATTGGDNDWKEVKKWFDDLWKDVALEKTELSNKTKIETKQYIIDLISKLFKEYSPKDLYYKVLYELFNDDLLLLYLDVDFNKEIKHLSETIIYKTLFSYQQKGVISLIKMLQKFNGAILADAVGLGKTWTALAVMKYFQSKGYTIVLLCPKKLENNWRQYQSGNNSKFEKDEIEYIVRYHTDLQDERLTTSYTDFPLSKIQRKQKILLVIDESHNLRNDKSSRYNFLVENILQSKRTSRDVKVLQLSATPINNKLLDIRNQFKLLVKGSDNGFKDTELGISSLENIFRTAQKDYTEWTKKPDRKISDFIGKLQENFFKLTDSLIVARTRKLIEGEFGEMNFPKKEKPINEYITPENIGNLQSFDDILDAIQINMTAYRPSAYIKERKHAENVLEDDRQRETFLVKMMYILLIKRLESSWYAFKLTVENILKHHENALNKVNDFIENKSKVIIESDLSDDEIEELEETASEVGLAETQPVTLGKKNPVALSEISAIKTFQSDLEKDVRKLQKLRLNLAAFEKKFNENTFLSNDTKLERLLEIVKEKQSQNNKKVLIFTVYKDTAKFLYKELKKRELGNIAYVSGSQHETFDDYSDKGFETILERFAPLTKLYNEKDWSELYEEAGLNKDYFEGDKWNVPFEKWMKLIRKDEQTLKKLENPIDILVATDCLSEGQNLQDCDMIINYDIHWNPVRLIQRMGRIDRLGSPNKTIRGINFWPAKDYEDYLNLKSRVENRMAAMTLVGTELDNNLTPELNKMIEENPLLSDQTQKMLQQLQLTWDDIEDGEETLGLDNLSLERFRQELFEFFKKNEESFKKMPNGVYTGFQFCPSQKWQTMPNSIVAVLGYPKKPDDAKNYAYPEIHLLHQRYDEGNVKTTLLQNRQEILNLLRLHKEEERFVPKAIDNGDPVELQRLAKAVEEWITAQAAPAAVSQIQDLFTGSLKPQYIFPEQKKTEEKFQAGNFDLINWFVISNK